MLARVPASQTRTRSRSPKSAWRCGSCCSGTHFAPGIWAAANSVSERTSTISGFSLEWHNCESSRTLMMAVNKLFLSFRKSPARDKRIRTLAIFLAPSAGSHRRTRRAGVFGLGFPASQGSWGEACRASNEATPQNPCRVCGANECPSAIVLFAASYIWLGTCISFFFMRSVRIILALLSFAGLLNGRES